jgi:4-amino-4-deoxy-L-arabinose transferase-like glycosyltransferase
MGIYADNIFDRLSKWAGQGNRPRLRQASVYLMPWVMAGLALRLWRASLQLVMFRDETTYAFQIKHLLAGTLFQDATYYTFPPAYSLLAAPFALVTGDAELAGRLVSCIMGAATAVPVYLLAREIAGLRTAVVAAAITALCPALMNIAVMSEPTYAFFVSMSVYLAWKANSGRSWKGYLLFGLCMGTAYLTRPEGFFVFAAALFVLVILFMTEKPRTGVWKGLFTLVSAALLGFFLLAFPYMLQLRSHFGAWELSGKTRINLAKVRAVEKLVKTGIPGTGGGLDAKAEEVYNNLERGKKSLGGNIASNMQDILARYPGNFEAEVKSLPAMAGYPLVIFAVAGLAFILARPGRTRNVCLPAAAFAPALVIPAVMVMDRVLTPYLPVAFIFSAYGISKTSELFGEKLPFKMYAVPALAAVLMVSAGMFHKSFSNTDTAKALENDPGYAYYYELRQTAERLRASIPAGSRIITRNNIFAFYAGGEYLPIPVGNLQDLEEFAEKERADYLFMGAMEMDMRPELTRELVGERSDYGGTDTLRLVFFNDDCMLYKFMHQEKS